MSLPKIRKNFEAEANTPGETEHFFQQEKSGGVGERKIFIVSHNLISMPKVKPLKESEIPKYIQIDSLPFDYDELLYGDNIEARLNEMAPSRARRWSIATDGWGNPIINYSGGEDGARRRVMLQYWERAA
jgi:hypothetical protein